MVERLSRKRKKPNYVADTNQAPETWAGFQGSKEGSPKFTTELQGGAPHSCDMLPFGGAHQESFWKSSKVAFSGATFPYFFMLKRTSSKKSAPFLNPKP